MKYLGIDFGLKNIGLSIAEGPLAEPLSQTKYTKIEKLLDFLNQLIQEQTITAIVLGIPDNGKMVEKIKDFANKLQALTHLPIFFQDETLSTQEAKLKLRQAHAPLKKRRQDHVIAATHILQSYLDDQPQV